MIVAVQIDGALEGTPGVVVAPGGGVGEAQVVLHFGRFGHQFGGALEIGDGSDGLPAIEGPGTGLVEVGAFEAGAGYELQAPQERSDESNRGGAASRTSRHARQLIVPADSLR